MEIKYTTIMKEAGYISLKPFFKDSIHIYEVVSRYLTEGIIKPEDYHLTLMYDIRNPKVEFQTNHNSKVYKATIKDIVKMGNFGEKWSAIAFELDAPKISNRHQELINMGYKHSYPDFIPHLSIKYMYTENDFLKIQDNKNNIISSIGEILLTQETCEILKDD